MPCAWTRRAQRARSRSLAPAGTKVPRRSSARCSCGRGHGAGSQLRQPGRVEHVQSDQHTRNREGAAPKGWIGCRPPPVVRPERGNHRELEEPPTGGKSAPQAKPDMGRRVGPQREIWRVHREIQQKMREHRESEGKHHSPAVPGKGRGEQERPHEGHQQRVRPIDVVE